MNGAAVEESALRSGEVVNQREEFGLRKEQKNLFENLFGTRVGSEPIMHNGDSQFAKARRGRINNRHGIFCERSCAFRGRCGLFC